MRMTFYRRLLSLPAVLLLALPLRAAAPAADRIVVARDGSGDFTTLQAAIDAVPDHSDRRTLIYIRNGVYDTEKLIIPETKRNITLRGEDRRRTIVSYHAYNYPSPETGGLMPADVWERWRSEPMLVRTSATLIVLGEGCRFENLTLRNTAPPLGQALVVTVCADRTSFYRCDLLGYQDTIYLWQGGKRSYFERCLIVGRTDYIYGGGIGYFRRCEISSFGGGWVTAPSTDLGQPYGFVFDRCRFTYRDGSPRAGDDGLPYALGRPWHNYPKVALLRCRLSKELDPAGWPTTWNMPYAATSPELHLYEYRNRGAGADMSRRARWTGLRALDDDEAAAYAIERVFGEDPRSWR